MKLMLFDDLGPHGLKGSETDVEGDLGSVDATLADSCQDFGSEMESCRGRSDGATLLGVDGLIAFPIDRGIVSGDVRRQRNVADLLDLGKEVIDGRKTNVALAEGAAGNDLGAKLIVFSKVEVFSNANLATGADQAFPIVGVMVQLSGKQDFDASAEKIPGYGIVRAESLRLEAFATPVKTGREYSCVIKHEEVVRAEQFGEIAEFEVLKRSGGAGDVQKAGSGAIREGLLRDPIRRKFVMKIGDEHALRL